MIFQHISTKKNWFFLNDVWKWVFVWNHVLLCFFQTISIKFNKHLFKLNILTLNGIFVFFFIHFSFFFALFFYTYYQWFFWPYKLNFFFFINFFFCLLFFLHVFFFLPLWKSSKNYTFIVWIAILHRFVFVLFFVCLVCPFYF